MCLFQFRKTIKYTATIIQNKEKEDLERQESQNLLTGLANSIKLFGIKNSKKVAIYESNLQKLMGSINQQQMIIKCNRVKESIHESNKIQKECRAVFDKRKMFGNFIKKFTDPSGYLLL